MLAADRSTTLARSRLLGATALIAAASACGGSDVPDPAPPLPPDSASAAEGSGSAAGAVHLEIVNVDLRVLANASVHVTALEGRVSNLRGDGPVVLDDPAAYVIDAESASTFISWVSLSRILDDYTFGFDGAPIGDLEAKREEDEGERDRIEIKGNLNDVLGVAFEIEGRPEVMPDGRIRVRAESIQALDIPVGGLLHALGLDAGDVIGSLEDRGISFDGDDLILDPGRALPPPRVRARVTALRIEDDGVALSFGAPSGPPPGGANRLWFHGGVIRIGRMTQTGADLLIVDQDPGDPLDFFPGRLNDQLGAGEAKIQADGGLTLHVPDFGDGS